MIKSLHLWVLFLTMIGLVCCKSTPVPVAVIFDTDIAPDYDDVGALAVLHALANRGEAEILATISSNAFETTAPTLSVINTYFNRTEIPVGVVKDSFPLLDCSRLWAQNIIARYPHSVKSNAEAADAVKLYRMILSSRADTSVTIITVGTLTNLRNLVDSPPDEYSQLSGLQLVQKKVKQLVAMAGRINYGTNSGYEFNLVSDIKASQRIFTDWPRPIVLAGFEIGEKIFTGMRLIQDSTLQNSPVKEAYSISIAHDGSAVGRYSWDQTAVLAAVRGFTPNFNYRKLNLTIKDDGRDSVIVGDRIIYLTEKAQPAEMTALIEGLMMEKPKN